MIVTLNNNPDKYIDLFIEAHKFLEDANVISDGKKTFNSLPEYYSHMADFFQHQGYKYVMLPLDEDPFNIDLNNRTISVPASFNKCASVQNDQLAETIVFISDRYFDYMDLANTEIYVQWTVPADTKTGREAINGATFIEMRDLETYPGKIRFAWPLNDAITKYPGTVKFSVRFVRVNQAEKLVYSLNTLEAALTIKPALQPDLTASSNVEKPVDDSSFAEAIVNSIFLVGVEPPKDPYYSTPGSNIVILEPVDGDQYVWTVVDKIEESNDVRIAHLNNNTLTFGVQAVVADSGDITYEWFHKPITYTLVQEGDSFNKDYFYYTSIDNENYTLVRIKDAEVFNSYEKTIKDKQLYYIAIQPLEGKSVYVACNPQPYEKVSEDSDEIIGRIPLERYFARIGTSSTFTPYGGNEFPSMDGDETVTYYEMYNAYTIPVSDDETITGIYYADAYNTIPVPGKKPEKTLLPRRSDDCLLPGPSKVIYVTNLPEKGTLLLPVAGQTYNLLTNEHKFDETTANYDYFKLVDENQYEEILLNEENFENYEQDIADGKIFYHDKFNATLSVAIEPDAYEAIPQYKWLDASEKEIATTEKLVVEKAGFYSVETSFVVNRKKEQKESNLCKVTKFPKPIPVIAVTDKDLSIQDLNTKQEDAKVSFTAEIKPINNILLSETVEGIWQMKVVDEESTYVSVEGVPGITVKTSENGFANDTIEITNDFEFASAYFRCLTVNTLNNHKAVFDHVAFGDVSEDLGTFELKTPYIYDENKEASFVFQVRKK